MTYKMEKEMNMRRIILDFEGYEKPKVADVLRRLLSDYRRSFEMVLFQKDTNPYDGKDGYYADFYIRESDVDRLYRLLGTEEA